LGFNRSIHSTIPRFYALLIQVGVILLFNIVLLILKQTMSTADFEKLIAQHNQYLQPFAISLTENVDDAADLCQETMLRALLNRQKYSLDVNIKGWLYTIMRNTFINNYRRSKRMVKLPDTNAVETLFEAAGLTAKNEGYRRLQGREIAKAMDTIPASLRLPFELHYTGYKYAEIASLLDEPLGTIKSRIHFARKALSALLER
jgi:RNA polymerase sigma-70 factor (ECF subfamily)